MPQSLRSSQEALPFKDSTITLKENEKDLIHEALGNI